LTARAQRRFSFLLPDAAAEWAGAALSDVFPDGLLLHPLHGGVTRLEGWQRAKRPSPEKLAERLKRLGASRVRAYAAALPRAFKLNGRFPVQRLGSFVVLGADQAAKRRPKAGERRIVLVQGQAFGTGLHESTRLMLRRLERIRPEGLQVLDIGAGSGILGFACLHLGAARVSCVELERAACAELRENRALNAVAPSAMPVLAGAYPLRRLQGRRFPLLLANLVTPLLLALMPKLARQTAPGGALLCSGIHSAAEARQVTAAARREGLRLKSGSRLRRWHGLHFVRP
jgi:ribosomal protein L11 methylase PrmA